MNRIKSLFSKIIVFTLLFLVFSSSSNSKKSPESIVLLFNESFNSRDFKKVASVLDLNLKIIDYNGDNVCEKRNEYLSSGVYFPAVFDTKWTIHKLTVSGRRVSTIESDSSRLNDFLYNQPLKMRYEYIVENERIIVLKYDTLIGFSILNNRAQNQYNKLFSWGEKNFPAMKTYNFKNDAQGAKELNELLNAYQKRKK